MKSRVFAVRAMIVVAALICVPFWYQMSIGLILGYLSSELFNRLLELRVDVVLGKGRVSFLTFVAPLAGTVVLALPMVAAFTWPQYVSWIGVLAGLVVSKAVLYLVTFANKPVEANCAD